MCQALLGAALLGALTVGASAGGVRGLPPDVQAQILKNIAPVIGQACATTEARAFDQKVEALRARCPAGPAPDATMTTYLREETRARCVHAVSEAIRTSPGRDVRVELTEGQYEDLLEQVFAPIGRVNCPATPE